MKWNTPAVAELDVRMTENGWLDCTKEYCILTNDKKAEKAPSES